MSARRILVTALVGAGEAVRVFDDNSRGALRRLREVERDIEFVSGDIRDAAAVDAAMRGIDEVHHLAFVNGTATFYSAPDLVLDVGVKGIVNVIDGCRHHGVGRLILASSSEVYQSPPLVGGHARRRLVNLGARSEDQASDAVVAAAVDDVDDALDADVEHEVGRAVERRRAVDEGEMMHLVDAAHGGVDRGRIADVAADELDVAFDLAQPAQSSAGIVVEHAHFFALAHERLDQTRTEKAAAAGDQNAPRTHSSASPPLSAARKYHIRSAGGKPISDPYKRPQMR